MQRTGVAVNIALEARYVPSRLVPGLLVSLGLAAAGVLTALAGLIMGWILAAFMLGSAANTLAKMRRREPVLTLDAIGATDHRVPLHVDWSNVDSMRTVNRRVVLLKVPLLELVPAEPVAREGRTMLGAVVRGDISLADARDRGRLMIDLRYLDVTPEEVLGVARGLRR